MDNTNESKAERFVRLAEPRVFACVQGDQPDGHLAASSYEYTDKQVESHVRGAMQEELNAQKAKFTKVTDRTDRSGFKGDTA